MASFKLTIAEPKTGKCYKKEVKDNAAGSFLGLNVGEPISGDKIELPGFEFQITGGSDYCGFPMRKGILGVRNKITLYGGVGFKGLDRGIKKRKTVCGHKINEKISQINLKITKEGPKKISEILGLGEIKEEKISEEKNHESKKSPKAEEKPKEENNAEENPKEETKSE